MHPVLFFVLASVHASAQDDPCAVSEGCRNDGACHTVGEVCSARHDADCQQAKVCGEVGQCFEREGLCVATAESCPTSRACLERGRCELDGSSCAAPEEIVQSGLLGEISRTPSDRLVLTLLSPPASGDGVDTVRPFRRLDPSCIQCPTDTARRHEKDDDGDTRIWCALPDGRKKGPELVTYVGRGQRMYTEYRLDQAHGEHVITEADGRVMVRGQYEMGRKSGSWESWYVGGGRASQGEYQAGKKVGIWTVWQRSGSEKLCDYRDPAVPDMQCVAPKD